MMSSIVDFDQIRNAIYEVLQMKDEKQILDSLDLVVIRSKLLAMNIDIPAEQFSANLTLRECLICIQKYLMAGQKTIVA